MKQNTKTVSLVGTLCLALCSAIIVQVSKSAPPHSHPLGKQTVTNTMPETDSPEEALRWRRLAWVDENGQIAPGALARAIAQKQQLAKANHPMLSGDHWIEQGPANLSGRSNCLVIDPANALVMWMGSAGGGIWKSIDGGSSWTPVGDSLRSLAVNALTLDPVDKKTLYAGTGEGYFNGDAISGFGVYKSSDGGTTWAQLSSTAGWNHVNRIAISPSNSKIILATIQYGGIYRSADGGTTWSQVLSSQSAHSLAFSPANNNRVVGSIQNYDFATTRWYTAAVVSTDAGITWKTATSGLNALYGFGRIELAVIPSDEKTVYASASDGNVWKSTDGGVSYVKVTVSSGSTSVTGANWYGNAIWVDPKNPKRLVVGGTYIFGSTDGGVTLTKIGAGYIQTDQPHPDIHFFLPAPGYDGVTNKVLYVCTDGGLYQAADITTASTTSGWLRRDQGARTTQYYSVAGDGPTGRIVGGLQDNGTQSNLLGNNQANYIFGGDGGFVAIDPSNAQYVYGEYIDLELFRNNDGGSSTNSGWINTGIADAGTNANFIAPFILDPNQPQTLLAGGASLWRTTNARAGSPTWSAIRGPGSQYLSAIAVAKGNSNIIWVGQNDGVIAMTTNGTAAAPIWKTISTGGSPIPSRYVTRILVDPDNSNTVYVTFGGFTSNNVWMTTNAGTSWTAIGGTGASVLPQVPVRAIARRPGSPKTLYVGTEIGIFSTADAGQTWTISSDLGLNVSVDDLQYMNSSSTLLAATHGRGIWMLPFTTYTVSSLSLNVTSIVGGNSPTGTVTISPAATGPVTVNLSSSGSDIKVPSTVLVPTGATSAKFVMTTSGVASSETLAVTAAIGTSQKSANLTLLPSSLTGITLTPSTIVGGNTTTGTAALDGYAPTGGLVINLASSTSAATLPSSITIPAGSVSATFAIKTLGVSSNLAATITGKLGTASKTATLTIQPASLGSLSLSPSTVVGASQTSVSGTVKLNGYAPPSGTIVTLSSSIGTAAQTPASITIPSGSSSATFAVTHSLVTTSQSATIKATFGGNSQTATLTVTPFLVTSLALSPTTVTGGVSSSLTVTLSALPSSKSGAITVKLSTPSKAATVPPTVSIPVGVTNAKVAVNTSPVTANTTATITGTLGSSSQQAILAINSPTLLSESVSPSTVKGSSTTAVIGTVTLSGNAPTGGIVVTLTSSNSAAATVPASVTVPSGKSSITFTVSHFKVSSQATVTLSAKQGTTSVTTTLTVTAG